MQVSKVSVNIPKTTVFGASVQQQNPQEMPSRPPRKDYTKAIGWVAAGLATAGLAGVLIYNARKGKTSGASNSLTGVGTYLKKFLDDSIFAKSAEDAKNGVAGIAMKVSEDGNDWQMANLQHGFGCHLVKKVPVDRKDIPNFEFNSGALNLKIFNESTDNARFDFILGEDEFTLSMNVEPWRGKLKSFRAKDEKDSYNFTTEQCQGLLESLDLKKLIDEPSYRVSYTKSFFEMINDVVSRTKFQKIADKSGMTLDEVKKAFDSKEFSNVQKVRDGFAYLHYRYNLPVESEIFKSLKEKDQYELLDDFISGKNKLDIIDDFKESDVHFPEDKICYDLTLPTSDDAGVLEHLRFSKDKEYFLYERFNPEDTADRIQIKTYYPELTEQNSCITNLETKDASLYLETTLGGRNYLEVTAPDKLAEHLKFYFNSNRGWNEEIEYGDELQPYMGFIEKLAKKLSNDDENWMFFRDFPSRGKEMLEELAK